MFFPTQKLFCQTSNLSSKALGQQESQKEEAAAFGKFHFPEKCQDALPVGSAPRDIGLHVVLPRGNSWYWVLHQKRPARLPLHHQAKKGRNLETAVLKLLAWPKEMQGSHSCLLSHPAAYTWVILLFAAWTSHTGLRSSPLPGHIQDAELTLATPTDVLSEIVALQLLNIQCASAASLIASINNKSNEEPMWVQNRLNEISLLPLF